MPEGSEIYSSSLILNEHLANLYITNVEYTDDFKNSRNLLDVELVESDLPLQIIEIFSKAKRINFICENSKKQGSVFVWFYAMTGRLCFEHRGKPLIILTLNKNKTSNKNNVYLYYEDSRTLGFVKYAISEEQIEDIYKDVGPDFMRDEVSLDYFTEVIHNKRIKTKKIAQLLIEQNKISSIGNYLRAEILYASKISPFRELQDLSDKDIKILYTNIIKIMKKSAEQGGMSFRDYLNPLSEMGNFECKIYGKKIDPLGNKIITEKMGTPPKGKDSRRTIHWVPTIQK